MNEKSLEIQGISVKYFEKGQGKPVFLLHGWGGSKESWEPLLDELDLKTHHYFALDLPGFGKTPAPDQAWAVQDYVDFFQTFIEKIYQKYQCEEAYDLIVHSFGGRMAILLTHSLAKKQSIALDKLILIAAAGIKPQKTLKSHMAGIVAYLGKKLFCFKFMKKLGDKARKLLYKVLRSHDYENTSGVMREIFLKVIEQDLKPFIEKIQNPTLIIWGTEDTYVPVRDAYFMHEHIQGSALKIIEKGRHGIHKTHANQVGQWINDFLKN